jgi:uncharacterized caspase-like protein
MSKAALLIGVSNYEASDRGLNSLPAAVRDIEAMRRVLNNPVIGGFDEIKFLPNPDAQTMQIEIAQLFSEREKNDLILLYFSGHGITDDRGNFFFATCNTRKDLIIATAVPANFVHSVMSNSRAKRQAVILDCCYSGAFDPSLQSKGNSLDNLANQLGAEGRVVLASSSNTQPSFAPEGSELSIYTRYLVEGLETGAGDLDEDGSISILELHDYASIRVQETYPNMTPKIITLRDKGFEIVLAKARVTDPEFKYRKEVQRYASRGEISIIGRIGLDTLQDQYNLSREKTKEIEEDVLRPYLKRLENLEKYKQAFILAIEQEREYPFSIEIKTELENLYRILGFRKEDVILVEEDCLKQHKDKIGSVNREYQKPDDEQNMPSSDNKDHSLWHKIAQFLFEER